MTQVIPIVPQKAPSLSDLDIGTLFDASTGTIDPRIYTDASVYELELERVFGNSWLFLCHESQIKKAGDYITTYMGEDPVVVARQRDGTVKAFLNQCRHRGMRICRSDAGNARSFTCVYHGWGYDSAGNLIAVPNEADAYGACPVDRARWSARPVSRIESYKGLVFGHWNPDAVSLKDYLGDFTWYLDATIDRSPAGMEAFGGIFYRTRLERQVDVFVGARHDVLRRVDAPTRFQIAGRRILLDQATMLAPNFNVFI